MSITMDRVTSMDEAKIAEILEKLKDSPMVRGEAPTELTNANTSTLDPTATTATASAGANSRAATSQANSYTITKANSPVQQACYVYYLRNGTWLNRTIKPYYSGKEAEYLYYLAGSVNSTVLFNKLCELKGLNGSNTMVTDVKIRYKVNRSCRYQIYTLSGQAFKSPMNTVNGYIEIPYLDLLKEGEEGYFIYALDNLLVEIIDEGADSFKIDMEYSTAWTLDYTLTYRTNVDRYDPAPHPKHSFDIHFPRYLLANPPYPAILTLHGGNWTHGDKLDFDAYTDRIRMQSCVHINMNYRLIDDQGDEPTKDDMLDDIKAVIKAVKDITYFNGYIDKNKLALMGYSAGGHLALMYGFTISDSPIPIALVISEAGPTCLYVSSENEYTISVNDYYLDHCDKLLGDYDPETKLSANNPNLKKISPAYHVDDMPEELKTFLVYSHQDSLVEENHANLLAYRLSDKNKPYRLVWISNIDHNAMSSAYAASETYRAAWAEEINRYRNLKLE